MRTLIYLLRELRRFYQGMSLVDVLIAACEELLAQNRMDSEMARRLKDDEKRFFTDQISLLKNENERLTKYVEAYKEENAALKRENERLKTYASTLLELALDDVDLPLLTTESTP